MSSRIHSDCGGVFIKAVGKNLFICHKCLIEVTFEGMVQIIRRYEGAK